MVSARTLILTLFVTYALGVLATRWFVLGAFALDRPTLVAMIAIPLVQGVVLAAWSRWFSRRRT